MTAASDAKKRARKITTVVFDVDGVLTDGGIILESSGQEIKRFNVQDGTGIKYLLRSGLHAAFISGRESNAVKARAKDLGVAYLYQGCKDKIKAYEDLKRVLSVSDSEIACLGDDLPDIPLMLRSGLAVAVANARPEVKRLAHLVTKAPGGAGAAREFAEWLLKATGRWDAIMSRYLPSSGGRSVQA
jgi:3-deoxy-D-manno-octulosonate 8-phosphate phosphatase (KDO 8-P phosphatase)